MTLVPIWDQYQFYTSTKSALVPICLVKTPLLLQILHPNLAMMYSWCQLRGKCFIILVPDRRFAGHLRSAWRQRQTPGHKNEIQFLFTHLCVLNSVRWHFFNFVNCIKRHKNWQKKMQNYRKKSHLGWS